MLTVQFPTVWTDNYKSKTSADRRLRQFLKKGSQTGPQQFWTRLVDLLRAIPKDILPTAAPDAARLLSAMHDGITKKDESRINLETAYGAYLETTGLVCSFLSSSDQSTLLEELLLPVIIQHLRPSSDTSMWSIPQAATHLVVKSMAVGTMPDILENKWPEYTKQLINDMKISAPEQSKDYRKSQDALIQQALKFALLQKQALQKEGCEKLRSTFHQTCISVTHEALSIVKNRNGKPYGVAGMAAELLYHNRELVLQDATIADELEKFADSELPTLVISPSASFLVDILYSLSDLPTFQNAWTASLKNILEAPEPNRRVTALEALLTSPRIPKAFDLALSDRELQGYIKSNVQSALEGSVDWDTFHRVLQSPSKILATGTVDEILSSMTHSLSLEQQAPFALQGLRQIVRQNPSILKDFLSTPGGSTLLQSLLLASESSNEGISQAAASVNSSIQTVLTAGSDTKQSVYDLIQQGLKEATPTSVSVETLIELAKQLVNPGSSWEEASGAFPNAAVWAEALAPLLNGTPKASLAITNPLSSAVYLVQQPESATRSERLACDADGYSAAYRMTQYVTRLFKDNDSFSLELVPSEIREVIVQHIALTVQLADDNLGLAGANGLWLDYNQDVEADAASFIADAHALIKRDLKQRQETRATESEYSLLPWAAELLSKIEPEATARSYYTARAYSVLIADAIEALGWQNSQTTQIQELLKPIQRSRGKSASY